MDELSADSVISIRELPGGRFLASCKLCPETATGETFNEVLIAFERHPNIMHSDLLSDGDEAKG
jgi:hypothetical protein